MGSLDLLKERRNKRTRFGFKPKVTNRVIIKPSLIQKQTVDLVQWCTVCKGVVSHARITYDKGKRACRCTICGKTVLINNYN